MLSAILFSGSTITSAAYYVATTGSDSNAGTLASPFLTLGKCQSAMQGGSVKTCYIRAGTYAPAQVAIGGQTLGPQIYGLLYLTAADNGETWSYYPPDGYDSATINGQATTGCVSNGQTAYGFVLEGASNITINGLAWENFAAAAVMLHGGTSYYYNFFPVQGAGTSNADLIENNIITNVFNSNPSPTGCVGVSGTATLTTTLLTVTGGTSGVWTVGQYLWDSTHTAYIPPGCHIASLGTGSGGNGNYNLTGCGAVTPETGNTIKGGDVVNSGEVTGATIAAGLVTNLSILHNVATAISGMAFRNDCYSQADNLSGLVMSNNAVYNAGMNNSNSGAFYVYWGGGGTLGTQCTPSVGPVITNNYVRDFGTVATVSMPYYLDDTTSGATVTGNIATGTHYIGYEIHGGKNDTISGNIEDHDNQSGGTAFGYDGAPECTSAGCMTGNTVQSNIVIQGSSSTLAVFCTGCADLTPTDALTASKQLEYPYSTGAITDSLSSAGSTANPQLTCWAYLLNVASPAYGGSVSFPTQPGAWGTPGFWGPPGWTIPQTGTVPSSPHSC